MKLSLRWIVAAVGWLVVCGSGVPECVGAPPPDPFQAPFEKLSGRELVLALQDASTRSRAFYELHRRAIKKDVATDGNLASSDTGYEVFLQAFYGAKITVVPQAGGALPLYLVTYNGLSWFSSGHCPDEGEYRVPRQDELFPPIAEPPQRPPDDQFRRFQLFNGDGEMLHLYSDNTFTPESFANVTGDGRLVHVQTENCGLEGADFLDIRTLQVATVEEKPRVLLHLLLNWNRDDWTHRVRDTDGNGISEIEIGPRTKAGIKPMVIFRWDKKSQTFVSTKLGKSDHFRLMTGEPYDPFPAFKKFKKEKLRFPATPGAVSANYALEHGPEPVRRAREEEFPNRLPADFWKLEPKAAVLAFADLNRPGEHRNRFRLAVDDRDGAAPPRTGSVTLTSGSQGCTGADSAAWFLRFDPQLSYLASAGSSRALHGASLELHRIPYDQARQIAAALWWLDRVRTHPENFWPSMGMSTQSMSWRLAIRDVAGNPALSRAGGSSFPGWHGTFTRHVFLEYAAWLLPQAFISPEKAAPPDDEGPAKQGTPEAHPSFETARQFLTWWTPDEQQISHALTTAAVRLVAGTKDAEILDLLRKIAARLPDPTKESATVRQAWMALGDEKRRTQMAFLERPAPSAVPALAEKYITLDEQWTDLWFKVGGLEEMTLLRKAVSDVLATEGTKIPRK